MTDLLLLISSASMQHFKMNDNRQYATLDLLLSSMCRYCPTIINAAKRISPEELEILQLECRELKKSGETEDVKAYLRANRAFHFSIYRAARSESLLSIIENLWLQIGPYLNLLRGSGNYSVANKHHQTMVDCLWARNENGVRDAVRTDIEAAYQVLLRLLK